MRADRQQGVTAVANPVGLKRGLNGVAIVTGASRGIGQAIAVELGRAGFAVAAAARSADGLQETGALIAEAWDGPSPHMIVTADVEDEESVMELFSGVVDRYGRIDLLVNNAGYVDPVGILETSLENWSKTLATNLTGAFLCTREFVRHNKRVGGKIVNVASTAGMSARPGWSAYAAAKAGLINFSNTMSEELKPYGIKVYCVAPGRTATQLRTRLAPNEDQSKILQPNAVGRLVRFLASPEADYIDQQTIVIRKPLL